MTALLVVVGAAVGAPLRYLTDRLIQSLHRSRFPWGTWLVNVSGSFVLGATVAAGTRGPWFALLATGFCGALTTWSTLGYETVRLLEDGAYRPALAYVTGSLTAGLAAAFAGAALALAA